MFYSDSVSEGLVLVVVAVLSKQSVITWEGRGGVGERGGGKGCSTNALPFDLSLL